MSRKILWSNRLRFLRHRIFGYRKNEFKKVTSKATKTGDKDE